MWRKRLSLPPAAVFSFALGAAWAQDGPTWRAPLLKAAERQLSGDTAGARSAEELAVTALSTTDPIELSDFYCLLGRVRLMRRDFTSAIAAFQTGVAALGATPLDDASNEVCMLVGLSTALSSNGDAGGALTFMKRAARRYLQSTHKSMIDGLVIQSNLLATGTINNDEEARNLSAQISARLHEDASQSAKPVPFDDVIHSANRSIIRDYLAGETERLQLLAKFEAELADDRLDAQTHASRARAVDQLRIATRASDAAIGRLMLDLGDVQRGLEYLERGLAQPLSALEEAAEPTLDARRELVLALVQTNDPRALGAAQMMLLGASSAGSIGTATSSNFALRANVETGLEVLLPLQAPMMSPDPNR